MASAGLQAPAWRRIGEAFAAIQPEARKLKRYIALLEFHSYGVIFELINVLTLWELRILPLAAGLFARRRELIADSAGALGEGEALLSLSLPLAEQEGFCLPEVLEGERPVVEALEMGHPLLDPGTAVRNDLRLGRGANVWIVTGSNMSGKSTFLKAAGVNLIIAGMGGPACARSLRWTPLALYSDINVRDSLDDGKSYFQVEVERVLGVLRAARESPMLLAIFDELFRGTNSVERIAIARAVIRHLRSSGALLLVATHDRSVAELVSVEREPGMESRHFEERVDGGVMRFDYRLREGEARSRNAIRVLELQGYPADLIDEARRRATGEG
jgi:DNA mismatch repair ATPase MutS